MAKARKLVKKWEGTRLVLAGTSTAIGNYERTVNELTI